MISEKVKVTLNYGKLEDLFNESNLKFSIHNDAERSFISGEEFLGVSDIVKGNLDATSIEEKRIN
jgi:hypothetical protein